MNINKLIIDTLKPLKVPVCFHKYTGKETTYIIFHEYFQKGEKYSEDNEEMTGHYLQINVFSKANYNNIVEEVKTLLSNIGFTRQTEYELYENDTEFYNKIIRFYYEEEI